MNPKNLEKASKVLTSLKDLDAEIIQIEAFAMLVADKETKCELTLSVEDLTAKQDETEKVQFDEYGFIKKTDGCRTNMFSSGLGLGGLTYPFFGLSAQPEPEVKYRQSISKELSDTVTLQVLGILLQQKQMQRMSLIKRLQSLGVNI